MRARENKWVDVFFFPVASESFLSEIWEDSEHEQMHREEGRGEEKLKCWVESNDGRW